MKIIYFVTGNKHKFEEVKKIFENLQITSIEIRMASTWEKLEIQANNLETIARTAAEYLAKKINKNFFIEDAGLFINALNGFPGPYSHYVFDTIGIRGILKLLENESNRSAEFRSVVALHYDKKIHIFQGITRGYITLKPRGSYGFGFDPIFIPEGANKTFAEMTLEEKNKYSHRAKAIKRMIDYLLSVLPQ